MKRAEEHLEEEELEILVSNHSYLITSPRVRVAEEELIIRVVIHHLFNPKN